MKFTLSTVGTFYTPKARAKLEKLGFAFRTLDVKIMGKYSERIIADSVEIEFSSLEELAKFGKKWGKLIVSFKAMTIEIYDDYLG